MVFGGGPPASWLWVRPADFPASGYYMHLDRVELHFRSVITNCRDGKLDGVTVEHAAREHATFLHDSMETVVDGTYDPCDESA